jgi:hypothetical protein
MTDNAGEPVSPRHDPGATNLDKPQEVRAPDDQRRDGRPTATDKTGIQPGVAHHEAPTVAPEEEGEVPSTEHAPGGDL